jgi:hypothetical protein
MRLPSLLLTLAALPITALAVDAAPPKDFRAALKSQLEQSKESKNGLLFYIQGQTVPGVVKEVLDDAVIVSNRENGRIVIRLERIDAVAGN